MCRHVRRLLSWRLCVCARMTACCDRNVVFRFLFFEVSRSHFILWSLDWNSNYSCGFSAETLNEKEMFVSWNENVAIETETESRERGRNWWKMYVHIRCFRSNVKCVTIRNERVVERWWQSRVKSQNDTIARASAIARRTQAKSFYLFILRNSSN